MTMALNIEKVKKILRLLESQHDGERANAAAMLHRIAEAERMNLDELMRIVYSGGPQAKEAPKPKSSGFWGGDPPPWERDAREETHRRRQREQEREERERREREAQPMWQDAKTKSGIAFAAMGDDELLKTMKRFHEEIGESMLTPWEREFTTDITNRKFAFLNLSDKQRAVILRILKKYEAYGNATF
jgi:hypothetical protein